MTIINALPKANEPLFSSPNYKKADGSQWSHKLMPNDVLGKPICTQPKVIQGGIKR